MVLRPAIVIAALWTSASLVVSTAPPPVAPGPPRQAAVQSDLDTFMKAVLARRDENWKKLQEFILDEREVVLLRGPSAVPIWGERREYSWYIQEGYFVRSPTRANGVEVPEDDRRKYEAQFLREAKEREKREDKKKADEAAAAAAASATPGAAPVGPPPVETPKDDVPRDLEGLLAETRRPQFVDSAYFLKFKFEQGTYALVGREKVEGLEVLRVEYYPERLFTHEQDQESGRRAAGRSDRQEDVEATLERMMNKVSLVTLWIDPASHQIVKYTFDNVNFDFLPGASLVRLDDLKASMTMSQPFPGVWLPRDLQFKFAAMLAIGPFDVSYQISYFDYREARTSGRIRRGGGRP